MSLLMSTMVGSCAGWQRHLGLTAVAVEPLAFTLCRAAGKSTLTDSLVAAAGIIAMENVSSVLA